MMTMMIVHGHAGGWTWGDAQLHVAYAAKLELEMYLIKNVVKCGRIRPGVLDELQHL